jgi:predicted MFS family arabinose efflux permease
MAAAGVSTVAASRPGIVHLVLALGGFAIGTTEFATMSLLPYLAHDLQISVPVAGHVISAYALGVVVGAPLITVLAARLPRRTLLVALMGIYALANGLSGGFAAWVVALIADRAPRAVDTGSGPYRVSSSS